MKEDKQPVDVLAVLDRALMLVNDDDDHDGQPFDTDKSAEVYAGLAQARAAVAELVEAVKQYRADYSTAGCPLPECRVCARSNAAEARLNAALARVGGVK